MPSEFPLSRRDFLRASAISAGTIGFALGSQSTADAVPIRDDRNLIILNLVGGPSPFETFDPKPNAPERIRGPFGVTRTKIPGVLLSEHLPKLAGMLDRFAIVRSVHHEEAPIHEIGQQILQTGRVTTTGAEFPHIGAIISALKAKRDARIPSSVILGGAMGSLGVSISRGQTAGYLGHSHEPAILFDDATHASDARYGDSQFGRSCQQAIRLIESGTRCVTVNMFTSVFNTTTWDCHADGASLPTTLDDYRQSLCPNLDHALTTLVRDLDDRGLLESTLVVAMGEMGRTPEINYVGGRDHSASCWSIVMAGAGVRGGQVIGASDAHGVAPKDRPVHASEVFATMVHALGIPPEMRIPGPTGEPIALTTAQPIRELFR